MLKNYLLKVLKSVSFFTLFCWGFRITICLNYNLRGGKIDCNNIFFIYNKKALAMFFLSLIPSLGIFFENKNRVNDYILFTIPRALEGVFDMFNKLGVPVKLDQILNLIFAFFMGLTLLTNNKYPELIPKSYSKFIKMIYG